MIFFCFVFVLGYICASPLTELGTSRNTSLVRRSPTEIILDCDPNAGKPITDACANACYYINCRKDGNYVARLDRIGNSERKRAWSGCNIHRETPGKSVCNKLPFSQLLSDKRNENEELNCDEFPMALTKQLAWTDRAAQPGSTNSLRCIRSSHNRSKSRSRFALLFTIINLIDNPCRCWNFCRDAAE